MTVNGTMPAFSEQADDNPPLAFIDSCLRGVGQVCFMNNPVTGLGILVAMFIAEPWLGFAGALGVVVSTFAAMVIGLDRARSAPACSASTASSSAPACRSSCSPTGTPS